MESYTVEKLKYTPEQLEILENEFNKAQYVDTKEGERLADELGITIRQLRVWFQNRRAKVKRDAMKFGSKWMMNFGLKKMQSSSSKPKLSSATKHAKLENTKHRHQPLVCNNMLMMTPREYYSNVYGTHFPAFQSTECQSTFDDTAALSSSQSSFPYDEEDSYAEGYQSFSDVSSSFDNSLDISDFSSLNVNDTSVDNLCYNEANHCQYLQTPPHHIKMEHHFHFTSVTDHQQIDTKSIIPQNEVDEVNQKEKVCRISSTNSVTSMILDMQNDLAQSECSRPNGNIFVTSLISYLSM